MIAKWGDKHCQKSEFTFLPQLSSKNQSSYEWLQIEEAERALFLSAIYTGEGLGAWQKQACSIRADLQQPHFNPYF